MPLERQEAGWIPGKAAGTYNAILAQLHRCLYEANVGADFVFPETADFSSYKLLIVPALYVADDALLKKIADYVHGGGHVLMTFKSGFTNENSAVRWERAPGPLREAAGFTYQEFSNLEHPLALKENPWHVSSDDNKASLWAEFLLPTSAKPLAFYDHPFFGRWPAITRNQFGKGTLTYEGTALSDGLQRGVVMDVIRESGLGSSDQELPKPVRIKHGVNRAGKRIHYYLNYSNTSSNFKYDYAAGHDLLTGNTVARGSSVTLAPWDLAILEEDK
jgi:beta-galactosidase